jgi:hypothetical protein
MPRNPTRGRGKEAPTALAKGKRVKEPRVRPPSGLKEIDGPERPPLRGPQKAKAQGAAAEARRIVVAIRRAQVAGTIVPATPTIAPVRA